jgi:hypothetical protein
MARNGKRATFVTIRKPYHLGLIELERQRRGNGSATGTACDVVLERFQALYAERNEKMPDPASFSAPKAAAPASPGRKRR